MPLNTAPLALTACPLCHADVSPLAQSCPTCGHPGPEAQRRHRRRVFRAKFLIGFSLPLLLWTALAVVPIAIVPFAIAAVIALAAWRSDRMAIAGSWVVIGFDVLAVLALLG